jgi:hypothetical protein
MSLRDHLQQIYDRHAKLTPDLVVTEARDPSHPLHDRFEWDDAVAGEAWRREQAHQLIRSVKVVYRQADEKSSEKSVRAFHAVRSDQGHVYEPVEKVTSDPFTAQLVLRDMEREWQTLRRRYEGFAEFYAMVRRDLEDGAA